MKNESTTIRISRPSKLALQEIAQRIGSTQIDVLAEAIEEYRKAVTLTAVNESFARLGEDEEAHRGYREEMEEWDRALNDGLEEYR